MLNYTCILDTNLWPTDSDTLKDHGDSDFKVIADYFGPILNLGVDGTEGLMKQWHELKEFVLVNFKAQPPREIWKKIHAFYADNYPLVARVINLMRVFPFSNALVERCFSTTKKIKTDWRANLDIPTVDMLLRIKKMGPELDLFSPKKSVELFFAKKPRRPDAQPYGPHKRSSKSSVSNSPKRSRTDVEIGSEPEED